MSQIPSQIPLPVTDPTTNPAQPYCKPRNLKPYLDFRSVNGARSRLAGGKENAGNSMSRGLREDAGKKPSFGGALHSMMSKGPAPRATWSQLKGTT